MFKRAICTIVVTVLLMVEVTAQVNVQTGTAVFNLPMFNWQDSKSRLSHGVALEYNSGNGLKVNDIASNIGQGWNLLANGVITRMQVGEPDDQMAYNGNGSSQDIRKYPAGILYASIPAYKGCPNALSKYPIYSSKNTVYTERNKVVEDRQLDYFSFQFNGKTGLFVVDLSNGGTGWSLGDNRMKISFQTDASMATNTSTGIRTTIKTFTIQDEDGLIYKFGLNTGERGLTKVLQMQFCDANGINVQTQPKFEDRKVYHQAGFENTKYVNPWVIGSWYLSEIDDPLTARKIQFSYNTRTIQNTAGADFYDTKGSKEYVIINHKKSITSTPEIATITYPDGHSIAFNYAANQRIDFMGQYALSTVDIKYTDGFSTRILSEYQLNTSYLILNRCGTPLTDYQKKVARLCLKSVKKISVDLKDDMAPYVFDYYTGTTGNTDDFVPPPFFYAKDIYGYYNGNNNMPDDNNGSIPLNSDLNKLGFHALKGLCFLNSNVNSGNTTISPNPKSGYARNGLLRQVVYPSGGTISYTYAQNTIGTGTLVGGVHVTQTSTTDGGFTNNCANPAITQYNYVMDGVGSASSLWGTEPPVNSATMANHFAAENRKLHFSWSCGLCCYWKYQYPGIISLNQAVSLSDFQNFMVSISPVLTIVSVITDIMDINRLLTTASGWQPIAAVAIDAICFIVELVLSCVGSSSSDTNSTVFYNTDLNGVSPMPQQFKRVEIIPSTGGIGKTVQVFTSSEDYPVWIESGQNKAFSNKQRFAPWAYGLTKTVTTYDVNGTMLKQTIHVYNKSYIKQLLQPYGCSNNPANQTGITSSLVSCKCEVLKSASQRDPDWSKQSSSAGDGGYDDPNSYNITSVALPASNAMNVDIYGMYTGRMLLDTTYERVYKTTDNTQYVQTFIAYKYNTDYNFAPNEIVTQQSNGDISYKNIRYSSDFSGDAFTTLIQNNIIALPVVTTTSIEKANSSSGRQYLEEKVTEYAKVSGGDIRPSRILEQRFSVPATAFTGYAGVNDPGNPAYKQTQTFFYNSSGLLSGMQDEGGRIIANIYDYNDKYIVAALINADPVNDKAAYTSFETASLGGWFLGGTANYTTAIAQTGSRALVLGSGNTLQAVLNPAKPYVLSLWATSGVTVSGGVTLVKSAPVANGFTYYEYLVPQGNSNMTIAGSATIDELRLYPQAARMRTSTYDPLIGKTSECDENGRITYYQYDNMGRLQLVQDENRNTVKMYEYNNVSAGKQSGCPGTYGNQAITETFTRNNCGTGYQGGDVPYSIPANKYTSTISQADADAKAEFELMSSAQSYANSNGGCSIIYQSAIQSQSYAVQTCPVGSYATVTYTVPAGRYTSLVSQADADQQAIDDLNANGQAYANDPERGAACALDDTPEWEADDNAAVKCQTTGGSNTGHQLMLMTDVNPNSSTYNTSQWKDVGVNTTACPFTGKPNLVINGNFEDDADGFGTDYSYVKPGNALFDWQYTVASNTQTVNSGFCSTGNHTSGGSKMLVVDGSTNNSQRFWYNVINVAQNTTYTFSFWATRLDNWDAPPIQVKINGMSVSVTPLQNNCTWQQVQITWNSGLNSTALIEMNSQSVNMLGNDFAIDDIVFKQQ